MRGRARKYTEAQVAEIRRRWTLWSENRPVRIARDLNIPKGSLTAILNREYRTKAPEDKT
jgi:hypothetical protein